MNSNPIKSFIKLAEIVSELIKQKRNSENVTTLEKVRAKTMNKQKNYKISELIVVLYQKISSLNLSPQYCK